MLTKHSLLMLLSMATTLVAASCSDPQATPLPSPTPPPRGPAMAPTPLPSATKAGPSSTPNLSGFVPTPTVQPDIAEVGPYIAYLRQEGGLVFAVLADISGPGKRSIPLPKDVADQIRYDGWANTSAAHISPDGRYFAYETGRSEPPYDLQLRIIRLDDQQEIVSIPVLRKEMNAAISELVTAAADQLDDYLAEIPEDLWEDEILFSIQAGIRTFEWSPVRSVLAFVAQIDGPSTDLYVLDPTSPSPARITAGLQNVQRLEWSPNGEWIAHGAAYSVGMGTPIDNYIVSRDGETLLDLPDGGLIEGGWSTSDWYFLHEAGHGSGDNALKVVHVPDPVFLTVWPGPFDSYAFDVPNEIAAVSRYFSDQGDPGTYLSTTRGSITEDIPIPLLTLVAWGRGPNRFAGSGDEGVFAITTRGEALPLFDEPRRISVSPDNEHLALYDPRGDGPTVLLSASSGQTTEVTQMPVDCVVWSPDSSSFFFVSSRTLYSFALDKLASELIDQRLLDQSCPMKVVGLY